MLLIDSYTTCCSEASSTEVSGSVMEGWDEVVWDVRLFGICPSKVIKNEWQNLEVWVLWTKWLLQNFIYLFENRIQNQIEGFLHIDILNLFQSNYNSLVTHKNTTDTQHTTFTTLQLFICQRDRSIINTRYCSVYVCTGTCDVKNV